MTEAQRDSLVGLMNAILANSFSDAELRRRAAALRARLAPEIDPLAFLRGFAGA